MTMETLILVEVTKHFDMGCEREIEQTSLVRSYEGKERANEDIELLSSVCPDRSFRLIPVPYIER